MPKHGYTKMFNKILDHPNIEVVLNIGYKKIADYIKFNKMIYTGLIDYFFDYKFGKLPYRSIRFEFENYEMESYQEVAVINHVGKEKEFTRVTEYKYLTGQTQKRTTIAHECTEQNGEPYDSVLTKGNQMIYKKYKEESDKLTSVIFCGRLAEYKYYNMDQVVGNSIQIFNL